jgi:cullin-4
LIPSLVAHLMTHSHYQQIFEDPYLKELSTYYVRESQGLAAKHADNGAAFINEATVRLEKEVERAKDLLPSGSWAVVRRETQEALFGQQLQWLAKTGEQRLFDLLFANGYECHITALSKWMDNRDLKGLAQIYQIFIQVQGTKILCNAFKEHVEASGTTMFWTFLRKFNTSSQLCVQKIVSDPVLDDDMINRLLDLKSFVDEVIDNAFADLDPTTSKEGSKPTFKNIVTPTKPHKDFVYAASDAFTAGFAARPSKPAELLARHLDRALRKGQREASDAEFARYLDNVLGLYKFTKDKDVFRAFYQKGLAKRLLLEKSASDDFEKAILKKLKDGGPPFYSFPR